MEAGPKDKPKPSTLLSDTFLADDFNLLNALKRLRIETVEQAAVVSDERLQLVRHFSARVLDEFNAAMAVLGFPRQSERPIKYELRVLYEKKQQAAERERLEAEKANIRIRKALKFRHFRLVSMATEDDADEYVRTFTVRIETSFSPKELEKYLLGTRDSG